MKMSKVKIKLDFRNIAVLESDIQDSLVETAERVRGDVQDSQTMPFMTGDLQNTFTFVDDSKKKRGQVAVVSDRPYARRLYFHPEYHFHREPWVEKKKNNDGTAKEIQWPGNPNAGAMWFEPYITGEKFGFVEDVFTQLLKAKIGQ